MQKNTRLPGPGVHVRSFGQNEAELHPLCGAMSTFTPAEMNAIQQLFDGVDASIGARESWAMTGKQPFNSQANGDPSGDSQRPRLRIGQSLFHGSPGSPSRLYIGER
jgi:hypothetical protein